MAIRGIIFDMDGTVVDSKLDFDAIRRDLGFAPGEMILETLQAIPRGPRRDSLQSILREHEKRGAAAAELMPGVSQFVHELSRRRIRCGILTRNSRYSTDITLKKFRLPFDPVLTRDDAPPKPDPAGLLHISQLWNIPVGELLFFGDYTFDLDCGRNAGIQTVLYAPCTRPAFAERADYVIQHFDQALPIIDGLCNDTNHDNSRSTGSKSSP